MREIKFRAWDTQDKTMWLNLEKHDRFNHLITDKEFVIMQYTGLLDKNGKEIYEGDIVRQRGKTGKVVARTIGWGGWTLIDKGNSEIQTLYLGDFEVIGNIYEHPELVK